MEHPLSFYVVFDLLKPNFPFLIDCVIDRINNEENLLVFKLISPVNYQIALQFTRFVYACKGGQLGNELITL